MRNHLYISTILLVVILTSCSGSNATTPSFNTDNPNQLEQEQYNAPVYISDWDSEGNPISGMGALGLFSGYIDTDALKAELIPLRQSELTDTLEVVDITNFLMLAPCFDCVKINSISLDADNNPVINIGIRHPFDAGDPLKPISGRNRADLHVFNVEGIVAAQSSSSTQFPSLGVTVSNDGLKNMDGFSTYLDTCLDEIMLTDATAHPYVMHFDDYSTGNFNPANSTGFESVTNPPPSGNLVMPMGSDYDNQDYVFSISDDSSFEFLFAIGCTYAVSSASKSERFTPEYRVPQHNKKAASEVRVDIISNDLIASDTLSTATLNVSVLDINHGVAVGDLLDQMANDSSIANVLVEIPGVTAGFQNDYVATGGDGRDPLNPLTFTAMITNADGAAEGSYIGLVKVVDSYPIGVNESPLLNSMDGIKRVDPVENPLAGLFDIAEFATYATFEIDVAIGDQDPIAVINTTPDPPDVTGPNPEVTYDGSASYDPDGGSITLFEWDLEWDEDPLNFDPDITGTQDIVVENYPCESDSFTVGLRVTDDDMPAGVSAITSVLVNVHIGDYIPHIDLGQGRQIRGSDTYHTGQSIVVDSTGLAHIITKSSSGVHYRTFDGTNMSSEITIPGLSANPSTISLAVDSDDEIHVVSQRYTTIRHTMTSSGTFTGVVDNIADAISGHSFSMMNMEANDDNDIMLTWYERDAVWYGELYYCLDTGSGFSSPALAGPIYIRYTTDGSGLMKSFRMVATPDGDFHYIYRGQTADMNRVQRIFDMTFDGSSWQSPRECSSWILTDLNACAGDDGSIHITGRNHSTNNMEYIRYDVSSDTWIPNMVIAYNSNPWIAGPMGTIMFTPDGLVHSIFVEEFDDLMHVKVFCQFWTEAQIQAAPDYVIDSSLDKQIYGHADAEWDADGNLMIVHENDYDDYDYETVFNHVIYN